MTPECELELDVKYSTLKKSKSMKTVTYAKSLIIILLGICFLLASSAGARMPLTIIGGGGAPTNYTLDDNCQAAYLFADNFNDSSGEGNNLMDSGR